jgi:putative ABC transport system permease protein
VKVLPVESICRDARYGFRGMRKRPAFTVLAITTLALGIGVNVASLAVAYGILVRPLPYVEPSKVIILNLLFADGGDLGFSPNTLQQWLPRLRTVETAAGYYSREVTVRSGDRTTVVPAALVTDRFFDVLGTSPELGHTRVLIDAPDVVVGRRVIDRILGVRAAQPVGALLSISGKSHSIGGIMPSDFAFPDDEIGLWLPSAALRPGSRTAIAGRSDRTINRQSENSSAPRNRFRCACPGRRFCRRARHAHDTRG